MQDVQKLIGTCDQQPHGSGSPRRLRTPCQLQMPPLRGPRRWPDPGSAFAETTAHTLPTGKGWPGAPELSVPSRRVCSHPLTPRGETGDEGR